AAGGEIAPRALALDAFSRSRIFDLHLRPIAVELIGDELREAGDRALPHLGTHHADVHGVVGPDRDPDTDLGRAVLRARDVGPAERQAKAERQTAGDGGGGNDEGTTVHSHGVLLRPWPRFPR